MKLKFNGKSVMRVGQRITQHFKPEQQKEDKEVKQNLSQSEQGRWSRLLTIIDMFFDEQLAISGKPDFSLSGQPTTEMNLSADEKALMGKLFKTVVAHFETGAEISNLSKQENSKEFAKSVIERMNQEKRERLSSQPDPPPAVLLAPTPTRKRIEEHYEKPGTIRTNVNGVKGMESYAPPPCILGPVEKEA